MSSDIRIGKPYIEEAPGCVRLCAPVLLRGQEQTMWFSVAPEYGEYLTDDRADAFVAGIFTTAMRDGADIVCEAPVTRRLLYQLNHYLVPMMAANMGDVYHPIKIQAAPTDVKLPCAGAVGTGWTGGVDCMFTLMNNLHAEEPSHRLTHLLITSNGSIEEDDNSATLQGMVEKAQNGIAAETGLKVVGVDTNLHEIQSEVFLAVGIFRYCAVILALQKLFGTFLLSASYGFAWFSFVSHDSFYYELVICSSFETDATAIYSEGGAYLRAQKLQALSNYPLAHKYLHPCGHPLGIKNCGHCYKCFRTQAALYGLGALDRFSEVFDVDDFERNKDWYFARLLADERSQLTGETLVLLRQGGIELSPKVRRMARTLRAAKAVTDKNKEFLSGKLFGQT